MVRMRAGAGSPTTQRERPQQPAPLEVVIVDPEREDPEERRRVLQRIARILMGEE